MYEVQTLENTCAAGDSCDAGAMCKAVKVCVSSNASGSGSGSGSGSSGNPPDDNGTESSCSCRFGGSAERFGALALSCGTLMSLAFRRRKRR